MHKRLAARSFSLFDGATTSPPPRSGSSPVSCTSSSGTNSPSRTPQPREGRRRYAFASVREHQDSSQRSPSPSFRARRTSHPQDRRSTQKHRRDHRRGAHLRRRRHRAATRLGVRGAQRLPVHVQQQERAKDFDESVIGDAVFAGRHASARAGMERDIAKVRKVSTRSSVGLGVEVERRGDSDGVPVERDGRLGVEPLSKVRRG